MTSLNGNEEMITLTNELQKRSPERVDTSTNSYHLEETHANMLWITHFNYWCVRQGNGPSGSKGCVEGNREGIIWNWCQDYVGWISWFEGEAFAVGYLARVGTRIGQRLRLVWIRSWQRRVIECDGGKIREQNVVGNIGQENVVGSLRIHFKIWRLGW